ncbi:MAG: UMP kinase [Bacteroidales bacterium]|jgi:uridylate kinase|nr:UMP kinase [Bacteroidales bacterium]HOW21330.1 UMP kinase [Tenuifilaceae bacterium]MBP8643758.1 UMP kinase [Bacteroidales bacterium]NLI86867.1 UMP kinase [Bacteroidales bacterium]HPA67492.1 UMP kinase [Tenuifilaceae bacterium]
MIKYKRILLKLSGEALMGADAYGISTDVLNSYARQIKEVTDLGVEVGIVIGGGNIFRGLKGCSMGFDRVKGDQMGMLATVINSLALQSAIEGIGGKARVLTATKMEPVGELYSKDKAIQMLSEGNACIIAGGTGNPFFTTDTASALRAVEINANILLKGTRVDGVYSADPEKDPSAQRFESITFTEAYDKKLKIMDLTAFTLCSENNLPILVFDMNTPGNLKKAVFGDKVGTLVKN